MAAKSHVIICQYTGVEFDAASARAKNHPAIAAVFAEANKQNRYGIAVEAIQNARAAGVTDIDEFVSIAREAVKANRVTEMGEARQRIEEKRFESRQSAERSGFTGRGTDQWSEGALMTARDAREVATKEISARTSEE